MKKLRNQESEALGSEEEEECETRLGMTEVKRYAKEEGKHGKKQRKEKELRQIKDDRRNRR